MEMSHHGLFTLREMDSGTDSDSNSIPVVDSYGVFTLAWSGTGTGTGTGKS